MRRVADELAGFAKVGIVDCDIDRSLCDAQGITSYPALKYYARGGPRDGTPIETKWNVNREVLLSLWAQGAIAALSAGGLNQRTSRINVEVEPGRYSEF